MAQASFRDMIFDHTEAAGPNFPGVLSFKSPGDLEDGPISIGFCYNRFLLIFILGDRDISNI
jgi:hypothetical protein